MWGALDFSKVTQIGSQLKDALQRAKTEFDKLDGPFGYENDSRHAGVSDPGLGGEFSVGAGLLSDSGLLEKRDASPRVSFAAEGLSRTAAAAPAAGDTTAASSSSNGKPSSLQLPQVTPEYAQTASTRATDSENRAPGQPSPAGKLVKKKVIKKIVRKVPAAPDSAKADAGTTEAEAAKHEGALAMKQPIVAPLNAVATGPDFAANGSTRRAANHQQAEPATVSAIDGTAGGPIHSCFETTLNMGHAVVASGAATDSTTAAGTPRSTPGKKEAVKKGLGAVKIQQQSSNGFPKQRQQPQPEAHEQGHVLTVQADSAEATLQPEKQQQQGLYAAASARARASTVSAEHQAHDVLQVGQLQSQEQDHRLSASMHEQQQQQQQTVVEQLGEPQQLLQSYLQTEQPAPECAAFGRIEQLACQPAVQQQQQDGAKPQQLEVDIRQLSLSEQHAVVEQLLDELIEFCIQHAAAEAEPAVDHGQHQQIQAGLLLLQQATGRQFETTTAAHQLNALHQHAAQQGANATTLSTVEMFSAAAAPDEATRGNAEAASADDYSAVAEPLQHQLKEEQQEGWELMPAQLQQQALAADLQKQGQQHHLQHQSEEEDKHQGVQQQNQEDQQRHHLHEEPCAQHQTERLLSLLKQQCCDLQQQLLLREQQIGRQAEQLDILAERHASLQSSKQELECVVVQLTAQNEKLAMRASKVNEEELQEVQREASERLAAAERKVFALMKEREALKRSAASAAAAATETADTRRLEAELKKKEELVAQLMEEGEKLSRRQLDLEGSVKRLRAAAKAAEGEKEKLLALLAAERAEAENLRKAKTKAERDLVAALEAGRQELEAVRQAGVAELLNARAEQAAAEATAAEAATEGLAGSLAASEARCAALADSVTELQEALDRQRAAADLREEMLRQDLADLERRAQAAELRHQELSSKLPEATAPLLRQISALQDASTAHAQAWAAAERSLTTRVREAEATTAAAAEAQRDAEERLTALHARLAAAEQAITNAKAAAAESSARANRAEERLVHTVSQLEDAQAAAQEAQSVSSQLREDLKQQEHSLKRKLGNEIAARKAAAEELTRVRQELSQLQGMLGPGVGGMGLGGLMGGGGFAGLSQASSMPVNGAWRSTAAAGPPALAAPGFKWVLVREAEDPAAAAAVSSRGRPQQQDDSDELGSLPGTPHSVRSGIVISGTRQLPLPTSGSTASSVAGFDADELMRHHSQAGPLSDAASVGGPASPSIGGSSIQQLHQAQLRQVQQRLGVATVGEAELHRLKLTLRQKRGECAALQGRLKELEETRDQLASELVTATHAAEKASNAVAELPKLQAAYQELQDRYSAAVELVGERDEQLEELRNDLQDMKQLYRQQIEALLAQPP